jgi:hypothetical protein
VSYADVPVQQRPSWQSNITQEPFHILDWKTDKRIPARLKDGVGSRGLDTGQMVFVPLTTPQRPLGALGMAGCPGTVYTDDDIAFSCDSSAVSLYSQLTTISIFGRQKLLARS